MKDVDYSAPVRIRWYADGELNVSANCLDRHLATRRDQVALIWEPDGTSEPSRSVTYGELHGLVSRFANVLLAHGVKAGDRVTLYLPMIVDAAVAMLACTRIGAVHAVVFGGFSPESLANRVNDSGSEVIVTADEGLRGGKAVPLKANVDAALTAGEGCPTVRSVLVVKRTGGKVAMQAGRDHWYSEEAAKVGADCPAAGFNAEHPLFILYTSGSTGKPKGALHTTGGYLVYAALTHKLAFDYQEGEVYWCTADVGWITGHSYMVYGPLANGATSLMFEGVPTYPDSSRFWDIVDKHQVNIFYTAPTAIRALMREGDGPVKRASRKSLRVLGTVGEPINPEAWLWYHRVVGDSRCPIVDTWWQTETGGFMILPLPGAASLKVRAGALVAHEEEFPPPRVARAPSLMTLLASPTSSPPSPSARVSRPALLRRPPGSRQRPGRDPRGRGRGCPVRARLLARPDAGRVGRRGPLRLHLLPRLPRQVLQRRRRPAGQGRVLLDHGTRGRRHQRVGAQAGDGRGGVGAGGHRAGGGAELTLKLAIQCRCRV